VRGDTVDEKNERVALLVLMTLLDQGASQPSLAQGAKGGGGPKK
jgi:hypothetical protein